MVEEENPLTLEAHQRDVQQEAEEKLIELKREKTRAKTDFTKCRRCLLVLIQSEEVPVAEIKQAYEVLDEALDSAMNIMVRLSEIYLANRDRLKYGEEIEKIKTEYSEAQNHAQVAYDQISSN